MKRSIAGWYRELHREGRTKSTVRIPSGELRIVFRIFDYHHRYSACSPLRFVWLHLGRHGGEWRVYPNFNQSTNNNYYQFYLKIREIREIRGIREIYFDFFAR